MRETKILSQESYKDLRKLLENMSDSNEPTCYCMNLDKEALDHSALRTALKSGQLDGVILYDNYKVSGYLKMTPPNETQDNWQILCYRVREENATVYFRVLLRAAIRRARAMGAKAIRFIDNWGCQTLNDRQNILSELGFYENRESRVWEIRL
tara:strand:- start:1843 stop:2301 length:459 start_codon:yes stop_codon:yes gene_type:complete